MKKGCIFLISARKHLLKQCLSLLDENYNKTFCYPILIFYHGKLYDDQKFRDSIKEINYKVKYTFHKLSSNLPRNLKKNDLFWNLKNSYAKKFRGRMGYLHAITFKINFMNYEELNTFDYLMVIDDDSWFKGKIKIDLFEELDKNNAFFGTSHLWNNSSERATNTRINLFNWVKYYVKKYNVVVKDKKLRESLKGEVDNNLFHSLDWDSGNCNIYNRKMFETKSWKTYNKEFNDIDGGYRYRWGDCEILGLYAYIFLTPSIINFNLRTKKLYEPQLPEAKIIFSKREQLIQKMKNIIKILIRGVKSFIKLKIS